MSVDVSIDVKANEVGVRADMKSSQTDGEEEVKLWNPNPAASTKGRKGFGGADIGVLSVYVGIRSIEGLLGSYKCLDAKSANNKPYQSAF